MTARVLAPPRLAELVPPLFADRHLVILTPATPNTEWAIQGAWAFARAAATGDRSVLLIDLSADGPMLDSGAAGTSLRGIADVFIADEPLNDAAQPQDKPGLFYIRRGAGAGGLEPVWASDRWAKLARGFASEGALLLLFAPPAALSHFSFEPDGIVVLAPQGYNPGDGPFPHIAKRIEKGTPLLAVVGEDKAPSPQPPVRRSSPGLRRPAPKRARFRFVPAGVLAIAAVVSGFAVWAGRPGAAAEGSTRGVPRPPAALETDAAPGDSLFYSVQVASFNALDQAMDRALQIDDGGVQGIVTPVRMGGQGTWYRVLTGVVPSARAADSLLQALWQSGKLERPQGTILRTPDAYRVGPRMPLTAAVADARGLRARGVPAYIVGAPDGTARVYVGAFDLPEQAHAIDSLLTAAGLTGTLVQRMGTTP